MDPAFAATLVPAPTAATGRPAAVCEASAARLSAGWTEYQSKRLYQRLDESSGAGQRKEGSQVSHKPNGSVEPSNTSHPSDHAALRWP